MILVNNLVFNLFVVKKLKNKIILVQIDNSLNSMSKILTTKAKVPNLHKIKILGLLNN